jgi:hypothetical protein
MTTRMVPGSSNDERTLALREVGRGEDLGLPARK